MFYSKRGSILIMTAVAAVFLIGLTAVVTDVGWMYYQKNRLETAVNAGWKAGYDKMIELTSGTNAPLSQVGQNTVKAKILDVIRQNGYSDDQLADVQITIDPSNTLEVTASEAVGLFFSRIYGYTTARVAASRENDRMMSASIVPLAIPHGVVKDLTKTTYSVDFFGSGDAFASGSEYILKLGSGGGSKPPTTPDDVKMILVPMDTGAQTTLGYERAYGVAFWCLKIEESDPGYTPVYWLLGYRGGSFFLPYDDAIISKLTDYGVNYTIITGRENVQAVFDQVNPNTLELYDRPRIAVYSSQDNPDPVETTLREARIPYGTYSKPPSVNANGWTRNATYAPSNATRIYDGDILAGALDGYHWVHLHHEDFTGFNGGCYYYGYTCKNFYDNGLLGSTSSSSKRTTCRNRMCSYCKSYFTASSGSWGGTYNPEPSDTVTNCQNARRRCTEKACADGTLWRTISSIKICNQTDPDRPQCLEYANLLSFATGFTSDPGSEPKPQYEVYTNGGRPVPDNADGWFNKGTNVQKMKWEVAKKVREHVQLGGFLFAQCFAPETLDLALWESGIHAGESATTAYDECLAFTGMHYKTFPWRSGATWFSDINSRDTSSNQPFTLSAPLDPRCQNHSGNPDTGSGHTASFLRSQIKSSVTILGTQTSNSNYVKYISGNYGRGTFTFLGGHYHHNVQAKRLVLNNVLLGSLVTKELAEGEDTPVTGKQKSNYGVIDPDNTTGGGANDYRDRFEYGFNQPLQMNDRIIPEPGNQSGPTDQAVSFRVNGDATYPPNRRVLIPITDIPPEVPINNTHNATAAAIYDLQGQDHPNGAYLPSQYAFGSSVRIIGFAVFEILDPSEYTRAGSTISAGDTGDLGNYQTGQVRGRFVEYYIKPGDVPLN